RDRDPLRFERAQDGGVVDEIAEDREGPGVGVLERERDGVADAEAHAEMSRPKDAHSLQCKVYCDENLVNHTVEERVQETGDGPGTRIPAYAEMSRSSAARRVRRSSRRRRAPLHRSSSALTNRAYGAEASASRRWLCSCAVANSLWSAAVRRSRSA